MQSVRVTAIIEEVCRALGIAYESPNHSKLVEFKKDAIKLAEVYIQLKDVLGDLYELQEKYSGLKEFRDLVNKSIEALDKVDHQIKNEAYLLSKRIGKDNDK